MIDFGHPARSETTERWHGRRPSVALLAVNDRLVRAAARLVRKAGYGLIVCRRLDQLTSSLDSRDTDAILVDLELPVGMGGATARRLRDERCGARAPAIALSRPTTSAEARLSALKAGFWDVVPFPGASVELLSKLATFVALKREMDALHSGLFLDSETGHYSPHGLRRKLRELTALTHRTRDAMSCVMFAADETGAGPVEIRDAAREFSLLLHHGTRNSDIIGRMAELRFVVLAPHTGVAGALRLAERFTSGSLSRHVEGRLPLTFSAGVAGLDCPNGQIDARPELLLSAAERALNRARAGGIAQVASVWRAPDERGMIE